MERKLAKLLSTTLLSALALALPAAASAAGSVVLAVHDARPEFAAIESRQSLEWVATQAARSIGALSGAPARLLRGSSSRGVEGLVSWLAEAPEETRLLLEVREFSRGRHTLRPNAAVGIRPATDRVPPPFRLDLTLTVISADGRPLAVASRVMGDDWQSRSSFFWSTPERALETALARLMTSESIAGSLQRMERFALLESGDSAAPRSR